MLFRYHYIFVSVHLNDRLMTSFIKTVLFKRLYLGLNNYGERKLSDFGAIRKMSVIFRKLK